MKVYFQIGQEDSSKKKRKLEGFEGGNQMAYKTKKSKSRDGRKKDFKEKRFSKMNVNERLCEKHEDMDHRQSKRLKVDKLDLLKAVINNDEDDIADSKEEASSQLKVEKKSHKRIDNLTEEQNDRIKQIYKEQHKRVRAGPFLELKEDGEVASLNTEEKLRYPLVFPDIEEVLTHLQYNRHLTRWLHLKRAKKVNNTLILSVEGPGLEEYIYQMEDCPTLKSCRVGVEFVSPLSYGDCVEHAFASKLVVKPPQRANIMEGFQNMKSSPRKDGFIVGLDTLFNIKWKSENEISAADPMEKKPELRKQKRLKSAQCSSDVETLDTESVGNSQNLADFELEESYDFCLKANQALPISLCKRDNFSRLDLVMSPREMAMQKYPLPFIARYKSFVKTKDEYSELTERSPMFGLDCEMCETAAGPELTRISIVNEMHEVVYEKLVKPDNKITNYLTRYSGITAKMLNPITTKLSDVQRELKTLLPSNAILVGQSLNCDLIAMKMMHPYVIDTSMIFNLSGVRHCKTKLKTLSAEFLSERIQNNSRKGHDSIEDALAALKLVQKKLSQSLEWGDAVLGYKRTEEESRKANLELLVKEKVKVKTRLRLALNAIVDDPSLFDDRTHHLTEHKQRGSSVESKVERSKEILLKLNKDEVSGNHSVSPFEQNVNETEIDVKLNPKISNIIYDEVAIIGSKKVKKLYESNLCELSRSKVKLIKANNCKEVMSKLLDLDAQGDMKRLIVAHLTSPCVCQVEKWASKLISQAKENDLIFVLLCGKEDSASARGAFFATLPTLDRMPCAKEVLQQYLKSIGYKNPQQDSSQEADKS